MLLSFAQCGRVDTFVLSLALYAFLAGSRLVAADVSAVNRNTISAKSRESQGEKPMPTSFDKLHMRR
jgi:hypothetical protein